MKVIYGFRFDCETTEPARDFVVELDFWLCSAVDALASMDLLVVLDVPDCARALPAKLF